MPIVQMEVPPRNLGGRSRRLTDEDIKALAEAIERGETVGDGEAVARKNTAHQRAQSACKAVKDQYRVVAKRRVWKVTTPAVMAEDGETVITPATETYRWALVPPTVS